ncbi:MAG TPA: methionine--tRNA ligase [Candidatus Thalassarchaeaceae archaeon]|nr:methionine--tRNA ligase [Candidatus Thalassarchaeaceae archaeon]
MEYVTIFMAWPYANGPLHLGHVAGNCLPADIQYRYERARGRRVLMCSGSDEHGTPITVSAEEQGVPPQVIVDEFHEINSRALAGLGCSWDNHVDSRGIEFGGALYNRTTDPRHKELVQDIFIQLNDAGLLQKKTMQQYCEIKSEGDVRFLPDRYVVGECPQCGEDGARGDQCDECGATYEASELNNPRSKSNPEVAIEVRDTVHLFYRLDLFQQDLEEHAQMRQQTWKPNVKAMTQNWLQMGLRPRAVTRDMEWGIEIPLEDPEWDSKRVYVWFEAVQGYYTCARIWAERFAGEHVEGDDAWVNWWVDKDGQSLKHLYFMGKDNIPFHTIIWPAILMGLNKDRDKSKQLHLEDNVPANEFLMLKGGQFSKSRKHGVWLPSFLERYDPDSLRYHLSINMPEMHDTDFRWDEFVDRVNNELIATYGNFVHRVMTLSHRLSSEGGNPLSEFDSPSDHSEIIANCRDLLESAMESMEKQRFKEALRSIMGIAQQGNLLLQSSAPWKYLNAEPSKERNSSLSSLSMAWRLCRTLAIATRPFMPFQSDKLWLMLGEKEPLDSLTWDEAIEYDTPLRWNREKPQPLFNKLDLEEILAHEQSLASDSNDNEADASRGDGGSYIQFEDFMKVEMRTGKILTVEDHPNADKLYVITIEDNPGSTRTVCAGLKEIYQPADLVGLNVVFVANLESRKLRGIMSEGMILAADDGDGNIRVLTPEGEIRPGSEVR